MPQARHQSTKPLSTLSLPKLSLPKFSLAKSALAKSLVLAAVIAVITIGASQVQAHPGHGANPEASTADPVHYLVEPVHAMPILAVSIFFAARWYRAAKTDRVEAAGN